MRYLLAFLLLSLPVVAEDANVKTLETVSANMVVKVKSILVQQQRSLGCKELKVGNAETMSILVDPTDATGKGGRWVISYNVVACGKPGFGNVVFDARSGKGIAIDALAPGRSLADPDLQRDVMKSFMMAAHKAMAECPQVPVIRETIIVIPPAKPSSPWREAWIGRACDKEVGQMVDFAPSKTGTTFKMTLAVKSGQDTK